MENAAVLFPPQRVESRPFLNSSIDKVYKVDYVYEQRKVEIDRTNRLIDILDSYDAQYAVKGHAFADADPAKLRMFVQLIADTLLSLDPAVLHFQLSTEKSIHFRMHIGFEIVSLGYFGPDDQVEEATDYTVCAIYNGDKQIAGFDGDVLDVIFELTERYTKPLQYTIVGRF